MGDRVRLRYLLLAMALVALLGVQTFNRQWSTDYLMHTATIDALREDISDPHHDMTGTDAPSERFSPYTVVLAATANATGVTTTTALQWAGLANLVAFLVAFKLFVTELTRPPVALYALLATLFLWGIGPWRWSGFLNLNSIGFGLPWPSMFATAVVLVVGWAILRYDATGKPRWLALASAGASAAVLSHPFTVMWAVVMWGALAVHRRLYRRGRIGGLAVAAGAAALLVGLWPYYPLHRLASLDGAYSRIMEAMYHGVPLRTVAAVPGIVVALLRLRGDRRDPLGLMLVGGIGLYGLGAVAGAPSLGRTLPLVMLAAHIGIGAFVADLVERKERPPRPVLAVLGVAVVVGVAGVAPAYARMVPRALLPGSVRDDAALEPAGATYAALDGALPAGSVVAAPIKLAAAATAHRYEVVEPGYPSAFLEDLPARRRDSHRFLDPSTGTAARAAIADRYDIDAVLCGTEACTRSFDDGDVVARGPSWTLILLAR